MFKGNEIWKLGISLSVKTTQRETLKKKLKAEILLILSINYSLDKWGLAEFQDSAIGNILNILI